LVGSYHTELTAYAKLRSGDRAVAEAMARAVSALYRACDLVLSPSPAADGTLAEIGVAAEQIARWDRGVDSGCFDPALRAPIGPPGTVNVLYAGRITHEKGADLLAEAFLHARASDQRLRLVLAGGGPELERLREVIGDGAIFLGWLQGQELARVYASADMFLFPSSTDTFGQVILEAQASGLPVVAVAAGGPLSLIDNGVSGLLCPPATGALADAVLRLAASQRLRERLARAGLAAARQRTWEQALERLGAGYRRVLSASDTREGADVAGGAARAA
jgi:glycosyltransferase involved in cell wall biosynthesis